MSKIVFLEPVENYAKDGKHEVKIGEKDVTLYTNGDNITAEIETHVITFMDGMPQPILAKSKGTAKLLPGDKYRLKLGIRTAYAKALKKLAKGVAEFYKDNLIKNIVKDYNELVSTIKAQGETRLDFIQDIKLSMPMKGNGRKNNKEVAVDGNN